jgi:fatty-acyl-CoA synthase
MSIHHRRRIAMTSQTSLPEAETKPRARPPDLSAAASSTYALLRAAAEWNPNGTALTFFDAPQAQPVRITHRQFIGAVHQAANLFHRLGVESGDVVSLLTPTLPHAVIALWAAEAAGIANPINFLLQADDIAAMLRAANAKILVALGPHPALDIWQKVQAVRGRVPSLKGVLTVGPPSGEPDFPALEQLMSAEAADRLTSGRRFEREDIAAYFHTGGSTGAPKIARHTHANQVFTAAALAQAWDFTPHTRIVNGLPLFHVAGSLLIGLSPLAAAGELVLPTAAGLRHPQVVAQHWQLVEKYRPTIVGGIPTSLVALLDVPAEGSDIGSVIFCATGGAPLPSAVAREFEKRFGLPVHEIYGMTECSGLIAAARRPHPPTYGSAGHCVDGVELQARRFLADGTPGEPLPPGEPGILVTRGPNLFAGYLDQEQTAKTFTPDGWLITGDLGVIDSNGLVRVTGRAKDVIIRSGHNIDPQIIEEAASRHPAVAVSAAVGLPDAYAGEVPILYVTAKAGVVLSIEEIEAHLRAAVPEAPARPREVVVLPSMPMTAIGKIAKPVLRRDATRRAAERALAELLQNEGAAARIDVEESSPGTLLVRVVLSGGAPASRSRLQTAAVAALARFNFAHEVGFE